ncbi:hypothetical protein FRC02_004396 [Tulasnella sp. 418]|nr:hypothetical protein FRC02_004396 [Tulasnella sp. 418]
MTQNLPSPDAVIVSPEIRLQELERKAPDDHDEISDKLRAAKQWNSLVPIHRLPGEILQDIFLLLLVDHHVATLSTTSIHKRYNLYEGPKTVPQMTKTQSPYSIAIAMVTTCSHWYQLALSISRLWSYLESTYPLELTEVLLDRSKQAPLHISFPRGCDDEHELKFTNLITSHVHRWISIETTSHWHTPEIFEVIDSKGYSAPLLERCICHDFSAIDSIPSFILERSPRFHELHIASMRYSLPLMSLSGLTDLSILALTHDGEPFTMAQFRLLFTAFPLLRTIFIRGVGDDDDLADDPTDNIEIPNIESISFHNMGFSTLVGILCYIVSKQGFYPRLKVVGPWGEWWVDDLSKLRSGNLVETLARAITWVSLKDSSGNGDYRLIAGQESCGVRSTLLEFPVVSDVSAWQSLRTIVLGDNSSLIEDMELLILCPEDHDWIHMALKIRLLPCLKHLTIIFDGQPEFAASYLINALYLRLPVANTGDELFLPHLKRLTVQGLCDLQCLADMIRKQREQNLKPFTYGGLERLEVELLAGEDNGVDLIKEVTSYFQELNIVFESIIHRQ